jgi:hypothetical protein
MISAALPPPPSSAQASVTGSNQMPPSARRWRGTLGGVQETRGAGSEER